MSMQGYLIIFYLATDAFQPASFALLLSVGMNSLLTATPYDSTKIKLRLLRTAHRPSQLFDPRHAGHVLLVYSVAEPSH